MKKRNHFLSLLAFTFVSISPSYGASPANEKKITSFRDLPASLRSQVQKQAERIQKRGKKLQGRLQIGHLFLCRPYCIKVGHLYFAKDKSGQQGVQLRIAQEVLYTRARQLQYVPKDSNLYIAFKNNSQNFALPEASSEASEKTFDPVLLSKGDDSKVFRNVKSEYLLPFQKERWGIYTSLQTTLSSRKIATANQIGVNWESPWGFYLAPRIEVIAPFEFFRIRTTVGLDYRFPLGSEGQGSSADQLSSSIFGYDFNFLYRVSPQLFVGLTLRNERSDISFSTPSPQGFSTKSDIFWVGPRVQYSWFYMNFLYGLSNSVTDELDYRGTAAIDSALATTVKMCPSSFRLWIFESFPCGFIRYRVENQKGSGNPILPSLDKASTTSISTVHVGLSFEFGQNF